MQITAFVVIPGASLHPYTVSRGLGVGPLDHIKMHQSAPELLACLQKNLYLLSFAAIHWRHLQHGLGIFAGQHIGGIKQVTLQAHSVTPVT